MRRLPRAPLPARASRACSPASSAGPARRPATCTGARSRHDNILTLYGRRPRGSRIADPATPAASSRWLICETRDDKGNAVALPVQAGGRHRRRPRPRCTSATEGRGTTHAARPTATSSASATATARPLLDAAGQRPRCLTPPQARRRRTGCSRSSSTTASTTPTLPTPDDAGDVGLPRRTRSRPTAPGFEVRTYRLCRRVLMFHHFPDEPDVGAGLPGALDRPHLLGRATPPTSASRCTRSCASVTQRRLPRATAAATTRAACRRVEFDYTEPVVQRRGARTSTRRAWRTCRRRLDGSCLPLDRPARRGHPRHPHRAGRRLVLQAQPQPDPARRRHASDRSARFGPRNGRRQARLGDRRRRAVHGPGRRRPARPGGARRADARLLRARRRPKGWQPFRPVHLAARTATARPEPRFVDLDGDGHADVLITEDDAFVWHASLGEDGLRPGAARRARARRGARPARGLRRRHAVDLPRRHDRRRPDRPGPDPQRRGLLLAQPGLRPLRRQGHDGQRARGSTTRTSSTSSRHPPGRHRRLAAPPTSSTCTATACGCTSTSRATAGATPQRLPRLPARRRPGAAISAVDLLGNGTACLVWSSPLPGDARPADALRRPDGRRASRTCWSDGQQPRRRDPRRYAPSTRFYLQDKRGGKPWITRLPFPVHVVERVETDRPHQPQPLRHPLRLPPRLLRRRGARVPRLRHGRAVGHRGASRPSPRRQRPPATTSTPPRTCRRCTPGPGSTPAPTSAATRLRLLRRLLTHDRRVLPRAGPDRRRGAGAAAARHRAARGPDRATRSAKPAARSRARCCARRSTPLDGDGRRRAASRTPSPSRTSPSAPLQPRGANRHAVFFTHAGEALSYHYERNPADPRIQHALTLEVDDFGNVLQVGADRLRPPQRDPARRRQADRPRRADRPRCVTYTENTLSPNAVDDAIATDDYRTPLPCEARTYELTGYAPTGPAGRFRPPTWSSRTRLRPAGCGTSHRPRGRLRGHASGAPDAAGDRAACARLPHATTWPGCCRSACCEPLGAARGELPARASPPGCSTQVFQRPATARRLLPDPDRGARRSGGDRAATCEPGSRPTLDSPRRPRRPLVGPVGPGFFSAGRRRRRPAQELALRPRALLPAAPLPRPVRPRHASSTTTPTTCCRSRRRDALGNRDRGTRRRRPDGRAARLPRAAAAPGHRPQPQPDRRSPSTRSGMVVGTAVMGKPRRRLRGRLARRLRRRPDRGRSCSPTSPTRSPTRTPVLGDATTRARLRPRPLTSRTRGDPTIPQPAAGLRARWRARPTSATWRRGSGSKIQLSFSYSDGFGREIQQKIQAEPGPLIDGGRRPSTRAGSAAAGRSSTTRASRSASTSRSSPRRTRFEFDVQVGVSPVLFYDPVGRVVATLHPNHTLREGRLRPVAADRPTT